MESEKDIAIKNDDKFDENDYEEALDAFTRLIKNKLKEYLLT